MTIINQQKDFDSWNDLKKSLDRVDLEKNFLCHPKEIEKKNRGYSRQRFCFYSRKSKKFLEITNENPTFVRFSRKAEAIMS